MNRLGESLVLPEETDNSSGEMMETLADTSARARSDWQGRMSMFVNDCTFTTCTTISFQVLSYFTVEN